MMEKLFDLPLPALLLGQQDVIYLTTIISIFFCFLFPIISLLMAFETYCILKCAIEWNTEQIMVNLYFSYKFFIWPQKGPSICSVTYILKNIFFPAPFFFMLQIFSVMQINQHYLKMQNDSICYVLPACKARNKQCKSFLWSAEKNRNLCLGRMLNREDL